MNHGEGFKLKDAAGQVQITRDWILRHLADAELTLKELYSAMQAAGYVGAMATVKRNLTAMQADGEVRIARTVGGYQESVYATNVIANVATDEEPLPRVVRAPLGVIPTKKYDPIAWMVVTSGAELEAA
jgi:adenosylcobinamide amidohydrolase